MALDTDKPMYPRPLFPSSREVAFREDRPHLIATRNGNDDFLGRAVEARVAGEEEDDSLEVIFSAETGAGRAHTPQRLNRTHTPQRRALAGCSPCLPALSARPVCPHTRSTSIPTTPRFVFKATSRCVVPSCWEVAMTLPR